MKATDFRNPAFAHEAIAPLRVLLLEHLAEDVERSLRELSSSGFVVEPTVVSTRDEFLEALASSDFAVILSAYHLPGWDGMQAFEELRRSGKDTPFILVTGVLGEEAAVECVKRGVSDYVLKNRLARLPIALLHVLEEKQHRESNIEISLADAGQHTSDHQLIENSVYGIFRVSPAGSFLYANPVLLQILACPSVEILKSMNLASDVFRFP